MPFVKGDPNINRNGRPRNPEKEMLRRALEKEGEKRGQDFWDMVAEKAFKDPTVMIAIAKKFIPDQSSTEHSGEISITEMPTVKLEESLLELNIGSNN
jgi:hypothetical protein